jgi:hypothetical protein
LVCGCLVKSFKIRGVGDELSLCFLVNCSDKRTMKISSLLFSLLLALTSCTLVPLRNPSSAQINPPPLTDLKVASAEILGHVEDYSFPDNCVPYLTELENEIDSLDIRMLSSSKLIQDAEMISTTSWKIRSTLHRRLPEFQKDCALQVQSTFRQLRFIEDYLLELSRKVTHAGPSEIDFQKQPVPLKEESPPFYQVRLNSSSDFQSGDLLITRGVSFLSGMIARLGQRATQFSHVVMVYKDPGTDVIKTIESYVGVGVKFYEMDFALKNENARILWLRARDKELAHTAAQKMGTLVSERLKMGQPIKYDYELNFNDPKTMSCAEVSQVAFQMASENQFKIPFYPNEISGAKSIIERLKLVEGETYEPGDMEIDPRFELVGEFQDLRLTRDSRQKDAIMTALFNWMENQNYEFRDNLKSRMAGGVIYHVRRTFMWPLVKKILKLEDFSKEIPKNMLKTVTLVNELGSVMLSDLKSRDLDFEKKYGVPMTYMDFFRALEEMRAQDLKLYQNKKTRKKSKIHKFIRPTLNV